MRALLGGEELSESNLLAHLGIIEQRSNELLQVRVLGPSSRNVVHPTCAPDTLAASSTGRDGVMQYNSYF